MSLYNRYANYLVNNLDSSSSIILKMTILGIITSCAAQEVAIHYNKSIPDKTKKFLYKQELMDCALSIGFLCTIGTGSKKLIDHLTSKGYLLNNRVMNSVEKLARIKGKTVKQLADSGFFQIKEGTKELNIARYSTIRRNFEKCREGLKVIGTVATSILTTNLLVPIFRNMMAKQPVSKDTKPVIQQTGAIPYNLPLGKITPTYMNTMSNTLKI